MRLLVLLVVTALVCEVIDAWTSSSAAAASCRRRPLGGTRSVVYCNGAPRPKRLPLHASQAAVNEKDADDDEDEDEFINTNILGRPLSQAKSSMFRYVSDFLKRKQQQQEQEAASDDANDRQQRQQQHFVSECRRNSPELLALADACTHLIAIPVDACHELLLELESVQRAVLYHCPVLVHGCIAGSVTRLPLLYVKVPATDSSCSDASQTLQRLVQQAVEEHVVRRGDIKGDNDDDDGQDSLPNNADGVRPVTVQFQTLEIDGGDLSPNEVLYTVADPASPGTQTLRRLVGELQRSIAQTTGWQTLLPPDEKQQLLNRGDGGDCEYDDEFKPAAAEVFRPRIPFMRLPYDWEWHLERQVEQDGAIDETFMLTSDQGGNGISPVHWGKWCDDVLGAEQRLREVAVYQRQQQRQPGRLSEVEFPVPTASVPLPDGTPAQCRGEARFAAYQEQRVIEAEAAWKLERKGKDEATTTTAAAGNAASDTEIRRAVPEDDLLLVMTRERLEALYRTDGGRDGGRDVDGEELAPTEADDNDNGEHDWSGIQAELSKPPQRDSGAVDDWTRQRIEKVVQSRARVQSELELVNRKAKSLNESNPVFERYKDGTLVAEKDKVVAVERRVLPPFPSREHFTGFWRMVGSPTGFAVEEGDASKSDNLVLRVDGTTAGGPILDQETRQKASGGSWRMTQSEEGMALLRIRLIIPPKKERVLVMEGTPEKVSMKVSVPLTTNTFGIPALEQRAATAAANDELEDLLICSGSVWIEDAITKSNRDNVGKFSIMKLNTPTDPSQFTITVPKNVRNQD